MSPEEFAGITGGEQVDDDRLLAYALGLEDDRELADALASDPQLRERLRRMETELGEVGDQLHAAVPPLDEGWTDLSMQRWEALRHYVQTRPAEPRRRRLHLKVLVPIAATVAAIALALGVTLSHHTLRQSTEATGGNGAVSAAGAPESSRNGGAYDASGEFKTIVVARAHVAGDDSQRFTVERVLKGSAPASVELTIEAGAALPEETLAVLSLLPLDTLSSKAAPTPVAPGAVKQSGVPTVFLYEGRLAAVQPLPPGTDPADVTLQ